MTWKENQTNTLGRRLPYWYGNENNNNEQPRAVFPRVQAYKRNGEYGEEMAQPRSQQGKRNEKNRPNNPSLTSPSRERNKFVARTCTRKRVTW